MTNLYPTRETRIPEIIPLGEDFSDADLVTALRAIREIVTTRFLDQYSPGRMLTKRDLYETGIFGFLYGGEDIFKPPLLQSQYADTKTPLIRFEHREEHARFFIFNPITGAISGVASGTSERFQTDNEPVMLIHFAVNTGTPNITIERDGNTVVEFGTMSAQVVDYGDDALGHSLFYENAQYVLWLDTPLPGEHVYALAGSLNQYDHYLSVRTVT